MAAMPLPKWGVPKNTTPRVEAASAALGPPPDRGRGQRGRKMGGRGEEEGFLHAVRLGRKAMAAA